MCQSTDDGASSKFVFTPTYKWHCWHMIKENSDDFWISEASSKNFLTLETLETSDHYNWCLCVYSEDRKLPVDNVTMKDINVTTKDDKFTCQVVVCLTAVTGTSFALNFMARPFTCCQ